MHLISFDEEAFASLSSGGEDDASANGDSYDDATMDNRSSIRAMMRAADENTLGQGAAEVACGTSCMNRTFCCLFGCVDLLGLFTASTLNTMQMRHAVRGRYRIQESCCKSFAVSCFCPCCNTRQMMYEMYIHRDLFTGGNYCRVPPCPTQMNGAKPRPPPTAEETRIREEMRARQQLAIARIGATMDNIVHGRTRQQRERQNLFEAAIRENPALITEGTPAAAERRNAGEGAVVATNEPPRGYVGRGEE